MNYVSSKLLVAALGLAAMGSAASAATIAADDFDRVKDHVVGTGWNEVENRKGDAFINSHNMAVIRAALPGYDHPYITTTVDTAGYEDITVSFDWSARARNADTDTMYVAWTTTPADDVSSWTSLGAFSSGGFGAGSETLSLGALADGQSVSIVFMADLQYGVDRRKNGFQLDNFAVAGTAVNNNNRAFVAPVPVPAGLPLLLTAVAGLGLVRRRRNASKG